MDRTLKAACLVATALCALTTPSLPQSKQHVADFFPAGHYLVKLTIQPWMVAPETSESLSRGTLDGVLFPLDSVVSYNVDKLVKYSTEGENFGSFIVAYSISDQAWAKLNPETQKAMAEAAEEVNRSACAAVDQQEAETKQELKDASVTFAPLSAATKASITSKLGEVGTEWAKGLDGRGKKAARS